MPSLRTPLRGSLLVLGLLPLLPLLLLPPHLATTSAAAAPRKPRDPGPFIRAGLAAERAGRANDAIQHYQRGIAAFPRSTAALYHLAELLHRAGAADQARKVYRELIRVDQKGLLPTLKTKNTRASTAARPVRPLRPGELEPKLRRRLGMHLTSAMRLARGYARGAGRDDGLALRFFEHVYGLDPSSEEALLGMAGVQFNLGARQDNIATLRRVLALNPNRTEAWTNLGAVHMAGGNLTAAEAAFRQGVELGDAAAAGALAKMFLTKAEPRATRTSDGGLVTGSEDGSIRSDNSRDGTATRMEEAVKFGRLAEVMSPVEEVGPAANELGNILNEAGMYGDALLAYERALDARIRGAMRVLEGKRRGREKKAKGAGAGGRGRGRGGDAAADPAESCTGWFVEHSWSGTARRVRSVQSKQQSGDTADKAGRAGRTGAVKGASGVNTAGKAGVGQSEVSVEGVRTVRCVHDCGIQSGLSGAPGALGASSEAQEGQEGHSGMFGTAGALTYKGRGTAEEDQDRDGDGDGDGNGDGNDGGGRENDGYPLLFPNKESIIVELNDVYMAGTGGLV